MTRRLDELESLKKRLNAYIRTIGAKSENS